MIKFKMKRALYILSYMQMFNFCWLSRLHKVGENNQTTPELMK